MRIGPLTIEVSLDTSRARQRLAARLRDLAASIDIDQGVKAPREPVETIPEPVSGWSDEPAPEQAPEQAPEPVDSSVTRSQVCSRCQRAGHNRKTCTVIKCGYCGKYGHNRRSHKNKGADGYAELKAKAQSGDFYPVGLRDPDKVPGGAGQ